MRVRSLRLLGLLALLPVLGLPACGSSSNAEAMGTNRRTYVIPHILEKSGRVAVDPGTFDTTMFATYVGGRHGIYDGGGATVELFLYDAAGKPLSGLGGDVCNPCTIDLSSAQPKGSISLDDEIDRAGAWAGRTEVLGFGVVVVSGDTSSVNLQGFVVNSHTNAFDLSVFGFEPQPLTSTTR